MWPIADKSVLQRLIEHISSQGINRIVVCCDGDIDRLQDSLDIPAHLDVRFHAEPLPRGTAGCILDAAGADNDELSIVFHANIAVPPDVRAIIQAHRKADADMTIMFNPSSQDEHPISELAQIYVCSRSILEHIPHVGYCDIKEGLIPELVGNGKAIQAVEMPASVGNFRSWRQYIGAAGDFLKQAGADRTGPDAGHPEAKDAWIGNDTTIHPSARIIGPVIIGERTRISEDAVIFGPTIIGNNVAIGSGAMVENSVLWDNSSIGRSSEARNCLVDYNAVVPDDMVADNEAVVCHQKSNAPLTAASGALLNNLNIKAAILPAGNESPTHILTKVGAILITAIFLWSYWPTVVDLWNIWQRNDEYSCGLLVPFLALYVIWSKRHTLATIPIKPTMWGLLAFLGAQALRGFGLFFWFGSAERLSLVLSIASLVLLLFGWQIFRKTFSVLLFLCLMLPLPNRVHTAVMLPLQDLATTSAVFCLEVLGYTVVREGNIIHLGNTTVAVAEACNGLRMVTAFFIIIGWVVLLVQRPWWEKLVALISGLPIALFCNTIRLTITSIAFTMLSVEKWEGVFHDFGGYAMMPLALAGVAFELWILTKLTTIPEQERQEIIVSKSLN